MNRNFTAICAAFFMCAVLIVVYLCPAVFSATTVSAEYDGEKLIFLTFDDGPSDRVTPRVLDVLKEEGVPATFFIIGRNAETRKEIIKREIAEGHTVAVHSYSHDYKKIYSSPEALIDDIDKCNKVLFDCSGVRSDLYRFPGGSYGLSSQLIEAVTKHGMRYVDWNASTRDAEIYKPTPAQLVNAAITTPANANRVVLLAHDSTTKTATAEALRDIITAYKSRGYTFEKFY